MRATNPYWVDGNESYQNQSTAVGMTFDKPGNRDRSMLKMQPNYNGIFFNRQWPNPVTVGANYYGENPIITNINRTLYTDSQGEWFSVQNTVPSMNGIPLWNPYERAFLHRRNDYAYKVDN